VTCDAGYSGSGDATCGTDGIFSAISCVAGGCTPTEVANSDYAVLSSINGAQDESVLVTCASGYSGGGTVTCDEGLFNNVICSALSCIATEVANSDHAATQSITGVTEDVVTVTCLPGYTGGGDTSCGSSGTFSTLMCVANSCSPTEVANSNRAADGSITGVTEEEVSVSCDAGYTGDGVTTCETTGYFSSLICSPNSCTATEVSYSDHSSSDSVSGVTGDSVAISCDAGYIGSGTTVICGTNGTFNPIITCTSEYISTSEEPPSVVSSAVEDTTDVVLVFSGSQQLHSQPLTVFVCAIFLGMEMLQHK